MALSHHLIDFGGKNAVNASHYARLQTARVCALA